MLKAQLQGFDVLGGSDWQPLGPACAELTCLQSVSMSFLLELYTTATLQYAVKELRGVLLNQKRKPVVILAG